MTVQTVKLAGKRFVILSEKDFRHLEKKARQADRLAQEERTDVAEARRRLADPDDKPIPWEKAKGELGLK